MARINHYGQKYDVPKTLQYLILNKVRCRKGTAPNNPMPQGHEGLRDKLE
jgi:hypothetical protein